MRCSRRRKLRTDRDPLSVADVAGFYESHPYPPPVDDLESYRRSWDDARRRAESHLFWPSEPYREDRSVLVAGCGTMQAAHYAVRWPNARVVGIDISTRSIEFELELKQRQGLNNLEIRKLAVERAGDLGESFEHVVCTGVLHHLPDPDAGLRALREVLAPDGALHVMVYAPYGRAGIYMLQEYCRQLGVARTDDEILDLAATLKALPPDHPLVPLLRNSPDFATKAGLADALLHPCDRAYTVSQFMTFLRDTGFVFGRWVRQAPYLPWCGAPAVTPHALRLQGLEAEEQYAEMELLRGTMVRHSAVAYGSAESAAHNSVDFKNESWARYVPVRLPDTIAVRDRVPPGSVAVLINRNHTYTDLYLPVNVEEEQLLGAVDGTRSLGEMCGENRVLARELFEKLWRWDQILADTSLKYP
jgi:SAM-dependent methyltransferase